MPQYTLEINYTKNINKAAKVKIKDSLNKTIFKSNAVLTKFLHSREEPSYELALLKFISTEYSSANKYADINKIAQFYELFGSYYIGDKSNISLLKLIPKDDFIEDKKLIGINDETTLSTETFDILKNILSDKNNRLAVEFNQKMYIFGQKSCMRNYDTNFNAYISLSQNIELEEKLIKQKEIEANEEKENNKLSNKILRFAANVIGALHNNNQSNQRDSANVRVNNDTSKSSSSKRKNHSSPSLFDNFLGITQALTINSDNNSHNYSSSNHSSSCHSQSSHKSNDSESCSSSPSWD